MSIIPSLQMMAKGAMGSCLARSESVLRVCTQGATFSKMPSKLACQCQMNLLRLLGHCQAPKSHVIEIQVRCRRWPCITGAERLRNTQNNKGNGCGQPQPCTGPHAGER